MAEFNVILGSFGTADGGKGGVAIATLENHEWVHLMYAAGAAEDEEWDGGRQEGNEGNCH